MIYLIICIIKKTKTQYRFNIIENNSLKNIKILNNFSISIFKLGLLLQYNVDSEDI